MKTLSGRIQGLTRRWCSRKFGLKGAGVTAMVLTLVALLRSQVPGPQENSYLLPNGWKLTPAGAALPTEDMILKLTLAPDGKAVIGLNGGFNKNGLTVVDVQQRGIRQFIDTSTAWLGLAWNPEGTRLFASGGGCCRTVTNGISPAPVYVYGYENGEVQTGPVMLLKDSKENPDDIFWAGLAHHPQKNLLYAANRNANEIVIFDTSTGVVAGRMPTEVHPYELLLDASGARLYCTNISSDTITVHDTGTRRIVASMTACDNPNDMALDESGRLYVGCANDNAVAVFETKTMRKIESISTAMHPNAPEGSTPNSLLLDERRKLLFVANADNNNVAVIALDDDDPSQVLGFIPAGWYPSALAMDADGKYLYIGNSKGVASTANPYGPAIPEAREQEARERGIALSSIHRLTKGAITVVEIEPALRNLAAHTRQSIANSPYRDDLLARAATPRRPTVVPDTVGPGSPIKHVIYIIKENRTYDQVLGDLPQGNGDPALTLFGREITPNQHKLAEEFVLLDNLYTDGEVSSDGHQWSQAAYATDFLEKSWPPSYSRRGNEENANKGAANLPPSGYIWDAVLRKGLTLRMYGNDCCYVGGVQQSMERYYNLNYGSWKARDYENARTFIADVDAWDKNFGSADPQVRMPAFTLMMLPEDHTYGTMPGKPTPTACVASNDWAVGMIVDRVSHSPYWPQTAIFIIEDDAQNGSDHVDARRTIGFVASPYVRRRTLDSTLYTTSSMLRTMELLLGLQPMSQFDAAATPMYDVFAAEPDLTPFEHVKPAVDVDEMNTALAWGAAESLAMDFSSVDRTPMYELNLIVWKSVKGPDSEMPTPLSRFLGAAGILFGANKPPVE